MNLKTLTLWELILLPGWSFAQTRDTTFSQIDKKLNLASTEMIRFDKQLHTGLFLGIVGGGATFLGTKISRGTPLIITGGAISIAGIIISALSSTHIKKAGLILSGNSLILPIRGSAKRKHSYDPLNH